MTRSVRITVTAVIAAAAILVVPATGMAGYLTGGAIGAKWNALNGAPGPATSTEGNVGCANGRYQNFKIGVIDWSATTNIAAWVRGSILSKYRALGFSCFTGLGLPKSDEYYSSRGGGYHYQNFDGGAIVSWAPATVEIHGRIYTRWAHCGYGNCAVGRPTSDERATVTSPYGNQGRYSNFEKGVIAYNPKVDRAVVLFGAIKDQYIKMGAGASYLGLPTSEEYTTSYGARCQLFEGGSIVWRSTTGAQASNHHC